MKSTPFLQPAELGVLVDDLRLVVEVLAADTVGEIVTHQLLDAVFQHITDNESDKQRIGVSEPNFFWKAKLTTVANNIARNRRRC